MRNVFFLALIGAGLIIGILYVQPAAEVLSVITAAGIFISLFLNYSTKLSADEAARKATDAERKATMSVQASIDNHALLDETKKVVKETHDAVNSTAAMLRKAEKVVNVAEGKELGKQEEKAEQAIRDEKEATE